MDLFPDGGFVRLQSRATGKFVHADEDWERVSLRLLGVTPSPSLNTVWRVEHLVEGGYTYVLLQSAAVGRYLSYSMKKPKKGHRGLRVTQRDRSEPEGFYARRQSCPWMWRVQALPAPDEGYVTLRYFACYLCANSRFFRWKKNFVTADLDPAAPRVDTVMHWNVHPVEASPLPRSLPPPRPFMLELVEDQEGDNNAPLYPRAPRTIRHVRANDQGEFDQNQYNWPSFAFFGVSVSFLKTQLRHLQGWNEDEDVARAAYTLCMLPGSHGRLLPLVTKYLPRSLDSMNIVAFRTASPGAAALRYPAPPAADDAAARVRKRSFWQR